MDDLVETNFGDLSAQVVGPVLTPSDEGFAELVAAWKLNVVHHPEVAVGVTSEADVVAAVRFARDNRLRVRVQATGHGAEVPITDGLLIVTRGLDSFSIDPDTRIATIGAGVRWGAVVAAAGDLGLATVPGSSSTVGVVGYLLGGGLGPLDRSHGFSSDWVRGFTVVGGDGEVIEANAQLNPDLFWALRGGKTGFGVVTQVSVELIPLPTLYGGTLMFDGPDIETALRAWVDYTDTIDDRVSTSVAIIRMPDLPVVPDPLRGHTVLTVRFAFPGDATSGEQLAAPLRAAAPVYLDALAQIPASAIGTIHNDPPDPSPGWTRGRLLGEIDQEFVSALLGYVGYGVETPLLGVEIRLLGGATATDVDGGSAVGGRASAYTFNIIGVPDPSLFDTVLPAVTDALLDTLAPWISPETTINFAGRIESAEHLASAWPPAILERLREVRARFDPQGTFA